MYFRKETRRAMAPWTWKWFMTSSESMRQVINSSFINTMFCILIIYHVYRVSQKKWLIEWCWSHGAQAQSPVAGNPWAWKMFFGRLIILRLCRIKCSPVMCLVKFSPTALNFGYDFFSSISHFFLGHPVSSSYFYIYNVVILSRLTLT